MMTVKTVCIEVAHVISHKDEKTSLFSQDQLKSVRKSSLTPVFKWKSALNFFGNDDCENCLYRGSTPYKSKGCKKFTLFTRLIKKCKKNSSHSRI